MHIGAGGQVQRWMEMVPALKQQIVIRTHHVYSLQIIFIYVNTHNFET